MTRAAATRQWNKLILGVTHAPKGKKREREQARNAWVNANLRAAADRSRAGWKPPEPEQPDMFGRSP